MKSINIKVILEIYITQGLNVVYEFLNRIEYITTDKHSKELMLCRKNVNDIEIYLKKIINNND